MPSTSIIFFLYNINFFSMFDIIVVVVVFLLNIIIIITIFIWEEKGPVLTGQSLPLEPRSDR